MLSVYTRAGMVVAVAVAGGAPPAAASGFGVPELSAAGLGTANAMVANPRETGAFVYNPAAMAFHDKSSVALGAIFINANLSVDTASGHHSSNTPDWLTAGVLQAAIKVNDSWTAGFGINAPFGLETRWPEGTFPSLSGSTVVPIPVLGPIPIPNGNQPTSSELRILDVIPSATYKVNENLGISAGVDYYLATEASLASSLADVQGDGNGWGWNLGVMYNKGDWTLGANYHSKATIGIDGTYTPLDQTLVMLGAMTPGQAAKVSLDLPWRLQVGVRYAVNPQLAVEVDWTRIGWSEFNTIDVKASGSGQTIFSDANDWEDTNAIRLGVTYDLTTSTQLRFGYSYDQNAQPDAHFSARAPDKDRQLFSIGIAQDLGSGYHVEAGYMYVHTQDRNYTGDTAYAGLGSEVNGSTALAGDYKGDVNLIAIEVSKTF